MEEENEVKSKISASTDELKNETVDTVKQVKETMKNVNVKEEAKATKGFITEIIKNPLEKIKEIATDGSNKYFKTAIILVIVWMIATLINSISTEYFSLKMLGKILLKYIKDILVPLVTIISMSFIIFLMNKKTKKSLITVLTTVVTTELPVIISEIVQLLTIISLNISPITIKIASFCGVLTVIFRYFAIKYLYEEDDEKTVFHNFVMIQLIYTVVAFIVRYLGIYI